MRRPGSGKLSSVASSVVSAKTLSLFALVVLVISLQLPWGSSGANGLPFVVTLVSLSGVVVGLLGANRHLRPRWQRWLWVAQLPLTLLVFWYLVRGFAPGIEAWDVDAIVSQVWAGVGHSFGAGAGLALAGAILAAFAGVSLPPRFIKPVILGAIVLIFAIAAPFAVISQVRAHWDELARDSFALTSLHAASLVINDALLYLFLAWWLWVPVAQTESQVAARIFPAGLTGPVSKRLFPRNNVEQVVARAATLTGLGVLVAATTTLGLATRSTTFLTSPGPVWLLLPALGAACYLSATRNWQRCAPARFRAALTQVIVITVTALAINQIIRLGLTFQFHGLRVPELIVGAGLVLAAALGWLHAYGFLNIIEIGQGFSEGCRSIFFKDISDDAAEPAFSVNDIPIIAEQDFENWSGAHRWVGPSLAEVAVDSAALGGVAKPGCGERGRESA